MLCPCSPAIIAIAQINGAEGDQHVRKNIWRPSENFMLILQGKLFADVVFGRDNVKGNPPGKIPRFTRRT